MPSQSQRIGATHFVLATVGFCLFSNPSLAYDPRADRGQRFALTYCSGCHSIGKVGESPLKIAPPFRTLHERYDVNDLRQAFAEGFVTGHPSMPQFKLEGDQIDDLLAYLRSL
jgi:cytochrome c